MSSEPEKEAATVFDGERADEVGAAPQQLSNDVDASGNPDSREWTLRASSAVVGGFFALFCTVGIVNAFGIFQDYYHRHQLRDKSDFDIAWIGSVASFLMFMAAAPAGLLVDKVGPKVPLGCGSIGVLLGLFMTSLCTQYYQFFLAQALLLGTSMAFLTIPSVVTASKHFNKHRGLATGIVISGSSAGGVIWPIACNQLLNYKGMSFGWTIRIVAFIAMPILALSTALARPPQEADSSKVDGEKGDGASQAAKVKKSMDISILKNRTYLIFVAGAAFYNMGMFTPFFFTTPYGVSLDMSPNFAFYLTSFLSAGSLFGRIGIGLLADRYGAFNLTSLAGIIGAVVAFCMTTATSKAGLTIWSLVYGFTSGAILSLQMQCLAGLATPETHGTAIGLALGLTSVTSLVGSPIAGELVPHGYLALSCYVGATLIVGGILFGVARFRHCKTLWSKV